MTAGNGGDLLVDLLRGFGTEAAFGVVSVHNLPLVDALAHQLRWVPTRTEAAAVNAADGYARTSGTVGCAVTSTGTGAGNAAGALIEALAAGSRVLHVTGQIPSEHLGAGRGVIHETRDQLGMLRACSAWAATVGSDAVADFSNAAGRLEGFPRGPVSLEWPIDLQYAPVPQPLGVVAGADAGAGAARNIADLPLDEAALDDAAHRIAAAERPLVWAGGGAVHCRTQIEQLLQLTGAGLLTSNAGRGVIAETDARVVGNFGASAAGAALLADADLLISVGTHFRSNETRSYRLAMPQRHIQIDIDPAAVGRVYEAEVGIVGEAGAVLDELLGRVASHKPAQNARPNSAWTERVATARGLCRSQLRDQIGADAMICDIMSDVLTDTAPRVRDITIPNSAWGNRLLPVIEPATNVVPRGGGIGQAVGLGIGAAIARPHDPTMVMVGDGGLAVQLGELATVAQEDLPITLVVFDDGGYGVLRNMQDRYVGRRSGVDLHVPDLISAAAAFDIASCSIGSSDEFRPAFSAAIEAGCPQMIRVDCTALGPMPVPFVPPVDLPSTAS